MWISCRQNVEKFTIFSKLFITFRFFTCLCSDFHTCFFTWNPLTTGLVRLIHKSTAPTAMKTDLHYKKTEYVAFELWSRLILYNFCSIIILHVPVKSRNRKYEYKVNFSLSMKICFDFLRGVAPPNIESLISKYILPIRPDRNYARQHRVQKPISFSYRFV